MSSPFLFQQDRANFIRRQVATGGLAKGGVARMADLSDYKVTTCQLMHGDPSERNFCGKPVKPGSSWCPEHHAVVFVVGSSIESFLVSRGKKPTAARIAASIGREDPTNALFEPALVGKRYKQHAKGDGGSAP